MFQKIDTQQSKTQTLQLNERTHLPVNLSFVFLPEKKEKTND